MEHRKKNKDREERIARMKLRRAVQLSQNYSSKEDRPVSSSLPYEFLIKAGCI
jgi:hypothetical protein